MGFQNFQQELSHNACKTVVLNELSVFFADSEFFELDPVPIVKLSHTCVVPGLVFSFFVRYIRRTADVRFSTISGTTKVPPCNPCNFCIVPEYKFSNQTSQLLWGISTKLCEHDILCPTFQVPDWNTSYLPKASTSSKGGVL